MALIAADRAKERPDEVALRDDRIALSWAEVHDIENRVTNGLHAQRLGDRRRVAVFAENSAETVLAHVGGMFAGCSVVPVNFHFNADEVEYILRDSGSEVLFTGPENLDRAVDAVGRVSGVTIIAWRSPDRPAGVLSWEEWLAGSSNAEPRHDVAPRPNLMYTSGTTGLPKGVDLPPTMFAGGGNLEEFVANLQKNRFIDFGTHIVIGPMYHTGPLGGVRILAAGGPVVVLGRFDPENVLRTIEKYRTGSSVMVPTHFKRLLDLPDEVRAKYDVSSMKLVAHTGAACPVDVKWQMIKWWGPVLMDAYGATEVGTTCTINSEEWMAHPGSVGRAVPPFSVLVVDDDGNEVPAGTEGRLYFEDSTGRGIVYPNDPEKTAKAHLRPGVFTLGEIGYVDNEGFVYITDRFSDMIVSGGVNIYPAEAEKVIIEHPGVADVAVIGVPDATMGEAVKALVVPKDPKNAPTPEELIGLCRSKLSGYKCPKTVEIVATVGRNAMGKVNKRALRAPYWEGSRTIG
jgi:acyl-CoA synthetase (AMP-forming)/AMP-acid ligase II